MNGIDEIYSDEYTIKFPFFRDDVFLIATFKPSTNMKGLIFQKIDPYTNNIEFSDEEWNINTLIVKKNYAEYTNYMEKLDDQEDLIKSELNVQKLDDYNEARMNNDAVSQGFYVIDLDVEIDEFIGPTVIELSQEDEFFAFKSWVQGIAEAGIDALQIQAEIDNIFFEHCYPIASFLLINLIKVDQSIISQFLNKIEKECRGEGVYHKSSLRANLGIVLDYIFSYIPYEAKEGSKSNFAQEHPQFIQELVTIAELDSEYLFNYGKGDKSGRIRRIIAEMSQLVDYPEYKKLLDDENNDVAFIALENLILNKLEKSESKVIYDIQRIIGKSKCKNTLSLETENNHIISLKISSYLLNYLPDSIKSLNYLKSLTIDSYYLLELLVIIGQLKGLEVLNLTYHDYFPNNTLTTLPENFGCLRNLKEFYLNNSHISKLPESFGNLISLEILKITGTYLVCLPTSFGKLANLRELYLENNVLSSLPNSFCNLRSLQILNLSKNQLVILPKGFGKLSSLKKLNLTDNLIHLLPKDFNKLSSLIELHLENNPIKVVPEKFRKY